MRPMLSALVAALVSTNFALPTPAIAGTTQVAHGSTVEINVHGTCRRVTNSTGQPLVVPHSLSGEWVSGGTSFLQNPPPGATVAACAPSAPSFSKTAQSRICTIDASHSHTITGIAQCENKQGTLPSLTNLNLSSYSVASNDSFFINKAVEGSWGVPHKIEVLVPVVSGMTATQRCNSLFTGIDASASVTTSFGWNPTGRVSCTLLYPTYDGFAHDLRQHAMNFVGLNYCQRTTRSKAHFHFFESTSNWGLGRGFVVTCS